MGCSSVPCSVFLFLFSAGLILAGTSMSWNREDELGYVSTNGASLFRYNQILFWLEWVVCLLGYISKHSMYNSMAAAILVVIVAKRQGSGIASFERVDFYRMASEGNVFSPNVTTGMNGSSSSMAVLNATESDYQQAAAGGVMSYFGALFSWMISLPGLELSKVGSHWIVILVVAAAIGIIGNIVLWASDPIAQSSELRNTIFDTTMYTLWALMFAVSAVFCNLAPVLTTIMFFGTWVMLSEFANMFYVQEVLVKETGSEDVQIWAGYCLTWGAVLLANIVIANTLYGNEILYSRFARAASSRAASRRSNRVGPDPGDIEEHTPKDVIPAEDDIATVFG